MDAQLHLNQNKNWHIVIWRGIDIDYYQLGINLILFLHFIESVQDMFIFGGGGAVNWRVQIAIWRNVTIIHILTIFVPDKL